MALIRTLSRLLCIGPCALAAALAEPAQTAEPAARVAAFANLPDWTGLWKLEGSPALIEPSAKGAPMRDHPPYNAQWEARYQVDLGRAERQADPKAADAIVDTHTIYCTAGMPRLVATPFEYQFAITPEAAWLLVGGEVRTVFTDGRAFPPEDEMWPQYAGWSIGRWDGDVLMIETRDLKPGLWADMSPMMLSAKAVVRERLRRMGADVIEDQVTITDPAAFTAPWTFTRRYLRETQPAGWPDEREVCGGPEDRNPIVGGHVLTTLAPK